MEPDIDVAVQFEKLGRCRQWRCLCGTFGAVGILDLAVIVVAVMALCASPTLPFHCFHDSQIVTFMLNSLLRWSREAGSIQQILLWGFGCGQSSRVQRLVLIVDAMLDCPLGPIQIAILISGVASSFDHIHLLRVWLHFVERLLLRCRCSPWPEMAFVDDRLHKMEGPPRPEPYGGR